jgi:hypothetical protein
MVAELGELDRLLGGHFDDAMIVIPIVGRGEPHVHRHGGELHHTSFVDSSSSSCSTKLLTTEGRHLYPNCRINRAQFSLTATTKCHGSAWPINKGPGIAAGPFAFRIAVTTMPASPPPARTARA